MSLLPNHCNDDAINDIYIGTTSDINNTYNQPNTTCNNDWASSHNVLIYMCSRETICWDNWTYEVVKTPYVIPKEEEGRIKRHYMDKLNSTLNYMLHTRAKKERHYLNRDHIKRNRCDAKC